MQIKVIASPGKVEQDAILQPLLAFNAETVGPSGKTELTFHAFDDANQLLGGANGYTHWNYFFVAHLWVREGDRRYGVGSKLLKQIEAEAVGRGCTHCWLDTFSFQAARFYEKAGYKRFGVLEDYPKGHERIFFSKRLS